SMPYFLLNQFDPSVPLHKDFRGSLAGQLGERLLPFTLRRTDKVTQALAEGTTVMDYAPNSGIAEDFLQLANWLAMWQGKNPDPRRDKETDACPRPNPFCAFSQYSPSSPSWACSPPSRSVGSSRALSARCCSAPLCSSAAAAQASAAN